MEYIKRVVLLSTGGTIASVEDPATNLIMAGEQTGEQLLSQCNHKLFAANEITVDVHSVFQVPSNQMTFQKNIELIKYMENQIATTSVDGFVVTHGTDTLEESAYFVSLYWRHDTPVIFTGAQFSPTENNTDAFHNITSSVLVAADDESKQVGVVVVFNDKIFSSQYVTKFHSSNIDGFAATRTGPLGIVDFGRVHYFNLPPRKETYSLPNSQLKEVEIIKSYMGMNTKVFDFYFSQNVSGLIVEAFGRGHVDLPTSEQIEIAVKKGICVVITSSCINGEVAEVYGFKGSLHDLVEKGGINGRDYDAKKARLKLIALLSDGVSMNEIQNRFKDY